MSLQLWFTRRRMVRACGYGSGRVTRSRMCGQPIWSQSFVGIVWRRMSECYSTRYSLSRQVLLLKRRGWGRLLHKWSRGGGIPPPWDSDLRRHIEILREIWSFDSQEIIKFVAIRCQILRLKCTKFDFGAPAIPSWEAYSAPPDPVAGLRALRLRRGEGGRGCLACAGGIKGPVSRRLCSRPRSNMSLDTSFRPAMTDWLALGAPSSRTCCVYAVADPFVGGGRWGRSPPQEGQKKYFWTLVKINPATENSLRSCRPPIMSNSHFEDVEDILTLSRYW